MLGVGGRAPSDLGECSAPLSGTVKPYTERVLDRPGRVQTGAGRGHVREAPHDQEHVAKGGGGTLDEVDGAPACR